MPIWTRSGVSRSQQASWIGAYHDQVCASSVLRYMESQCPSALSCWTARSQVAGLPFWGSSRTRGRAAGSVSALPPPAPMTFCGAPTSSAATRPSMSPPQLSKGNVSLLTFAAEPRPKVDKGKRPPGPRSFRHLRFRSTAEHELFDSCQGFLELRKRCPEGEPRVAAEPRSPAAAALARVPVEERARDRDHLPLQRRAEELHALAERPRQPRQVAPDVEGAVRRAIGADAHPLQPLDHAVALVAEGGVDRQRLLLHDIVVQQGDGRPLQRPRAAAVQERAGAGDGIDHLRGGHRPGDAPPRGPPVLGEPVEDHHRVAVHVLDVAGGALDGELAGPRRPHVMRVELVDQERALQLAGGAHPARELRALHQLAGRIAGIAQQQRREPASLDLLAQVVRSEGVSTLSFEEDGDGRERLEDVEQLLIGGVVGEEVPEVHVPERGGRARQRGPSASADAHVFRAVLRGHSPAVEAIVQRRDRLAQLPEPRDGGVLLIVDADADFLHARGSARERSGFGLTLSQVAPGRIRAAVAELVRFRGDVDDAGPRDGPEGGNGVLVAPATERNTSLADIDFGADAADAVLVPVAGGAARAAMDAVLVQVVAGPRAIGQAAGAGVLARACRTLLAGATRVAAGAAVLHCLHAASATAGTIRQAGRLVQAVPAGRAPAVVLADKGARGAAGREQEDEREEPHLATLSPLVARQAHSLRERGREEIAHLAQSLRHRAQAELPRVETRLHLAPAQRGRDGCARHSAQRVRRDPRLAVGVLHAVEVQPPAARGARP